MSLRQESLGVLVLSLFMGYCFCTTVTSKRILFLPCPFHSHVRQFVTIADQLADNGHEAFVALPSGFPKLHQFQNEKVRNEI